MAGRAAFLTIEDAKKQIHSIEEARAEGKTGMEQGSKILNTKDATYHGKK